MTTLPLKCTFIIPGLSIGGSEKQLLALVQNRPTQVEAHIIYMGSDVEDLIPDFKKAGAYTHLVARAGKTIPQFIGALTQQLRALQPEIVCTFLHGTSGTFGRWAAWLAGVKRIYHSDRFVNPIVTPFHNWLRPLFTDRLTRKLLPNTYATAEWLISLGTPRHKIEVIPNAIDLNYYTPNYQSTLRAKLGLPPHALIGGFLGRFRPEKKVEVLLAALAAMAAAPRPDHFLFGGEGPTWKDSQQRAQQNLWMKDHTSFLGLVTDPREFYGAIDFLVLPSVGEGTPNVVLEAMAMGKPIIATKICDLPQIVEGAGYLVEPNDVPSLEQALSNMSRLTPAARAELGQYARRKIELSFASTEISKKFWNALLV